MPHVLTMFQNNAVRISEEQLTYLALWTLEEAAAEATYQKVRQTLGIRLALAYLAANHDCPDHLFKCFWQSLQATKDQGRSQNARTTLSAMYRQMSIEQCSMTSAKIAIRVRSRLGVKVATMGDG